LDQDPHLEQGEEGGSEESGVLEPLQLDDDDLEMVGVVEEIGGDGDGGGGIGVGETTEIV
jgi:hypothetical protein